MKFQNVKISGTRRVNLEVHPAADDLPLLEGAEFDAMVEDVRANGFRHPVVIQGTTLIDGRNRLRAGKKLGIDPPVEQLGREVDVVKYIISTNIHRRHLTESQRAYYAATISPMPQGANRHGRVQTGKFAGLPTQAEAAKLLQVSERSVRDARRVIERGGPELGAAVKDGKITVSAAAKVAELGKTEQRALVEKVTKGGGEVKPGKVAALARQEQKRATVEKINAGKVRPLALGPFALIVVDYPWPYENSDGHEGSRGHVDYPPMSLDAIARHAHTDIVRVAADDAILCLWVTNAFINVVGSMVAQAGFTHRTMITWDKLRAGVGTWPRGQTEHLVIASRGKPVHTLNEITTYHAEERREHSRKPDRLMATLAKHCPGPHLELFARQEREGWSSWGAEVGKFAPNSAAPAAAPEPAAEPAAEEWDADAEWGSPPAPSAAAAAPEPSLVDACPKCGRELGEHRGKKCPRPAAPPAAAPEQLAEPWTCRGRPMNLMGAECGHVNIVATIDGEGATAAEVCGKCGCVRPRHGSPGKPAKRRPLSVPAAPAPARASVDAPYLKPGDMIFVNWQPGTTKRARFARYTRKGDLVVNVEAVNTRGVYLKKFGSDRTFPITDYAGRAPR